MIINIILITRLWILLIHPVERLCSWRAAAVARRRNSSNRASILAVRQIIQGRIVSRAAYHLARHRHPRVHPLSLVEYPESLRDEERPMVDPDYYSVNKALATGHPSREVFKVRLFIDLLGNAPRFTVAQ